jgi:transcriptional regulator with XRE-family HTH domain
MSPLNPATDTAASATAEVLAAHIAQRVHSLRQAAGLSLEGLAQQSGVSRSMISAVERNEANPTALVLDRLASALGVTLTQLLELPAQGSPLSRSASQALWQDPASGYQRRSLSPPGSGNRIRLMALSFPAGARIAYEPNAAQPPIHQQVWLQQGQLQVSLSGQVHQMHKGDCLAMTIDQPIVFFNPGKVAAQYLVAQA